MALTVLQRPEGHVLSDSEITVTVTEDYDGDALFTNNGHSLSTGDYIYVRGNIEDYNGFWYVRVIDANKFNIRPTATESNVDWIQDATVVYFESTYTHRWSCVHLPIVYRIRTNRWPTNSIDGFNPILSYRNDDGYVQLIFASFFGLDNLLFLELSSAPSEELNTQWQIIDHGIVVISGIPRTAVTLLLAYNSNYDMTGANAQMYYSSFAIRVNVYAGLDSSHYWAGQKPFELVDTMELTPDQDNEIKFSISDKLLKHMNTRNNLALSTLPNNLDFWTQFYITFQEIYDASNEYTLSTFEGPLHNDIDFKGYAVNAMLPFKNIHSGYLSDYIMRPGALGKFLTLFLVPVIITGCDDSDDCYFDVSFINDNISGGLVLRQIYYSEDVEQDTVDVDISEFSEGLYRVQLSQASCDYDQVKIAIYKLLALPPFTEWSTRSGDPAWSTTDTTASVSVPLTSSSNLEIVDLNEGFTTGITYFFAYSVTITASGIAGLTLSFRKNGVSVGSSSSGNLVGPGTFTGTLVINLSDVPDYAIISAGNFSANTKVFNINSLTLSTYSGEQYTRISEEKLIDINCNCDDTAITPDDIRLTEDGNFRILE